MLSKVNNRVKNKKGLFLLCQITQLQIVILTLYVACAVASPVIVNYAHTPLHTLAIPKTVIAHQAPLVHAPIVAAPHVETYDPNPHYSFSYGVNDYHTGDQKHAEETLANGVVHGSYSLTEPDGTIRKVTYTADKIHGFNAVVTKSGHPVVAAPIVKKVVAAPIVHAGLSYYH
jgi:hypothetical protein